MPTQQTWLQPPRATEQHPARIRDGSGTAALSKIHHLCPLDAVIPSQSSTPGAQPGTRPTSLSDTQTGFGTPLQLGHSSSRESGRIPSIVLIKPPRAFSAATKRGSLTACSARRSETRGQEELGLKTSSVLVPRMGRILFLHILFLQILFPQPHSPSDPCPFPNST